MLVNILCRPHGCGGTTQHLADEIDAIDLDPTVTNRALDRIDNKVIEDFGDYELLIHFLCCNIGNTV